jgi:uncharacterized protein YaeQ
MALKSTIFKADLTVADMDRSYYATHALTLARHPSETDERMMVRVLAFALNAEPYLEFGKGISSDDEPALWRKDFTGAISDWIEVGLPDEKWIRKACGRATRVRLYAYGGAHNVNIWWAQQQKLLERFDNLTIYSVPLEASKALAKMAEKSMSFCASIQDSATMFSSDAETVSVELLVLKAGK